MRFADLPPGAQATVRAVLGEAAANAKRKLVTRARVDLADLLAAQLRAAGLGHFQREQKFHSTRQWRIDIAFTADLLAIECDGFAARGRAGRHQRPAGVMADNEKYAELAIAGWRLIRVAPKQIRSGLALKWIERALA